MMETSGFAKYSIKGTGAKAFLDRMLACRIPPAGKMTLAPMLKDDGKLIGDFTLATFSDTEFLLIGSGIAENYHMRWFEQHLPQDGSVTFEAINLGLTGLAIAGPKSRDLLARLTHLDLSTEAFPFMAIRKMTVGLAPAIVGRVSYTGDLGYEIWMKPEYQRHIFDKLLEAGKEFGLRMFGLRALNSLRLEKAYGSWAREYRPLYGPFEAELGRVIALKKEADFIGKAAAAREKAEGGTLRLRSFIVEARDADVMGDEPIWHRGEVKGWVTSGGYAHAPGLSVAIGYVPKEIADQPDGWQIELLGDMLDARLQVEPLFDADGGIMRG